MFNIHTHSRHKVLSLSRLWYMGIKIDHTFCLKAVKQFKIFFPFYALLFKVTSHSFQQIH